MSWRLFSVLVGLAMTGLFTGCATGPRTAGVEGEMEPDSIQGPSTLIAGARVDDVRSLAMGAARSKGWTIVSATDQKLVLRRPVNTDAPQAVELGLAGGATPPSVEVKTYFLQRSDGVNVVANAQLVTQVAGKDAKGPAEQRTDYTESYRDSLMRSLGSLRAAWAAHHERVARALPPISQQGAAAAETAAELQEQRGSTIPGAPLQSPMPETTPTAWGEAATPEPVAAAGGTAAAQGRSYPLAEPVPMPESAPVSAPIPARAPIVAAPKVQTASPTAIPAPVRAAPTAATPASKSAPTSTTPAAKPTPTSATSAIKPAAKTAPVPSSSSNNIATLPPQGGSQIAKAESFAQSHGCKVRPGRTIVHKRDADADFLRVYCVGDPPFLVKCGSGRCKLIE